MPDPHRDYMRKKTIQSRLEEEWQKNPVRGEYDITDDIPYENVLRTYDVLDEAHEINQAELKILKKYMKTESTDSDEVQKNKLNEMIAFSRKVKYTSDCLIELDKLKKKYEEPSN